MDVNIRMDVNIIGGLLTEDDRAPTQENDFIFNFFVSVLLFVVIIRLLVQVL